MSKAAKKPKLSTEERMATPLFDVVLIPLVYALYRLFVTSVERMSPHHAYLLARSLGWLGWRMASRMRKISLRNLEITFGDRYTPQERARLGCLSVQHFMCTLLDVYLLPAYYQSGQWRSILHMTPEQEAQIARWRDSERSVAIQSAHLGSWEFGSGAMSLMGKPLGVVYRPLVVPPIDRDLALHRGAAGALPINKDGAMRAISRVLKEGGWLAIMGDQNAGQNAPWLDFFGVPVLAQVEHFPAYRRNDTRIATMFVIRDGFNFSFTIEGLEEERFNKDAETDAETRRLGRWYFDCVEAAVTKHPEQYLWMHRRFAHGHDGPSAWYNDLNKPLDREAARKG